MRGGEERRESHLQRLELALLRAKLAPPRRFRLGIRLDAALKPVDLLPPVVELLPHIDQFLREPGLDLATPLVELELDLAQRLESGDQVVVEDGKVGERLGFRLPALFLYHAYM